MAVFSGLQDQIAGGSGLPDEESTDAGGMNLLPEDQRVPPSEWSSEPKLELIDDPQIDARSQGYEWDEIHNHIAQRSLLATSLGYSQDEIDQYLGFKDPAAFAERATGSWGSALAENPDLFADLRTPYNPFDLTQNPNLAHDYAAALSNNEVKGPQDFADRYAAEAINSVHPDDAEQDKDSQKRRLEAMAGSTGELGRTLPTRSDTIDAALSLVVDPTEVMPVFKNLMDRWAKTGQDPLDAAMEAQKNPELFQNIVGGEEITAGPYTGADSILSQVGRGFTTAFGKMFQEEAAPFKPEEMTRAETGGAILGSLVGVIPGQIAKAAVAGGRALETTMTEGPGKLDPQDILTGAMLGMELKIPGGRPIHGGDKGVGESGPGLRNTISDLLKDTSGELNPTIRVEKPELARGDEGTVREMKLSEALAPTRPADVDVPTAGNPRPSRVTLGEGTVAPGGTVMHEIFDKDGQQSGFITMKHAEGDNPEIPVGTARVQMITSNSITGEQLGPRAVRDLARQYFEQNPDINKLEGFRMSGARERAGAQAEAAVTRDQVMGPGKRFDPEATPAEKIEAVVRDAGAHNDSPTFFRDLVKDEDPATQKLAESYDFTAGLWKVFKDLFADESGSLNLGGPFKPNAEVQSKGAQKAASFNFAYTALRSVQGQVADWARHFETPNSIHKLINQDITSFQKALRTGTDALQTKTGELIAHIAGYSPTIIDKNSRVWPVVEHYYDASARLGQRMTDAIQSGLISEKDLRRKIVMGAFNETSKAMDLLEAGQFKSAVPNPRTIMYEGIAQGLTPREMHPIDFFSKMQAQIAKVIEQQRALDTSEKAGFAYRERFAKDGSNDVAIDGTEKMQPKTFDTAKIDAAKQDPAYVAKADAHKAATEQLDKLTAKHEAAKTAEANARTNRGGALTRARAERDAADTAHRAARDAADTARAEVKNTAKALKAAEDAVDHAVDTRGPKTVEKMQARELAAQTAKADADKALARAERAETKAKEHANSRDRIVRLAEDAADKKVDKLKTAREATRDARNAQRDVVKAAKEELAAADKQIKEDATITSRRTQLFADPAFSRLWNRYMKGAGREEETRAQTFARKVTYWSNESAVLKLFLPFYHAGTMIKEAYTGWWATMADLVAQGNFKGLAKELALGVVPGSPIARNLIETRRQLREYYKGNASPEFNALVDVNGVTLRRPDVERSISERSPSLAESWRRGALKQELAADIRAMWPDNGRSLITKGVLAPFRSLEFMAKEIGRIYSSVPFLQTFWEKIIPGMKMGTNTIRMRYAMDADKMMSVEKRRTTARQIADDTDNRMGEMNQDNIMWPRWVKNILNTVFISMVSWKYGTVRLTAAGLGLNTDKVFGGLGLRSLEWNPFATRSLLAMLFSNALINSTAQWAMTGTFPTPWDQRPIMDKMQQAITPWFGGLLAKGAKELVMVPGQEKEFMDWAKIWQAGLKGGLIEFVKALGDYGIAGMKPPFSALRDLYVGQDAIGNDIKNQTGGIPRYLKEHFGPIFLGTMAGRKQGTAIPEEASFIGLRPAGSWWNDPANYWAGRERADERAKKTQVARERRDVSQLETPPEWAKDIPPAKTPGRPTSAGGQSTGSFSNPGGGGTGGAGFANPGSGPADVLRGGSRGGGGGASPGFSNPGSGSPRAQRTSNGGSRARNPNPFGNLRGVRRNRGNRTRA